MNDSEINPYFQQFKSHQFDTENFENEFILSFSKYGLIQLKNSSQNQALEIVRRRVDEVGTNEPNILKQGNEQNIGRITWFEMILVELNLC